MKRLCCKVYSCIIFVVLNINLCVFVFKIKSANDSEAQKAKTAQGVKKSEETGV